MSTPPASKSPNSPLINELRLALGESAVLSEPEQMAAYLEESRSMYTGAAAAIVLPKSTHEVSQAVRICQRHRVAVVPQGGITGRVGGATPNSSSGEVVINLKRMNKLRSIDPANFTMTAEAGCVLANIQAAAAEVNRLFPLRLGSEGSCQIGGNLASNAGGINALRYGSARELALGLEVVLADGQVWHGLNRLRKNNSGYDLRDLFIGSEGTLGIITAAVLKLYPAPVGTATAIVAVSDLHQALKILAAARQFCGETVTACEVIAATGIRFACQHIERCRDPFLPANPASQDAAGNAGAWYLLVETSGQQGSEQLCETLIACLQDCGEKSLYQDSRIAINERQREDFWRLREGVVEAQRYEGASIKHDISLPISAIPDFVDEVLPLITQRLPSIRPCPFGHLGDGNLHFNLTQPVDMDADAFLARWEEFNGLVHDHVMAYGGSFSAEHGIGRMKRDELEQRADPVGLELMHKIKQALDPEQRLNPGKVLNSTFQSANGNNR